jgi:hypothetical protein
MGRAIDTTRRISAWRVTSGRGAQPVQMASIVVSSRLHIHVGGISRTPGDHLEIHPTRRRCPSLLAGMRRFFSFCG